MTTRAVFYTFQFNSFPCLLRRISRNTENDLRDLKLRCIEVHSDPPVEATPSSNPPRSINYTQTIQSLATETPQRRGGTRDQLCEADESNHERRPGEEIRDIPTDARDVIAAQGSSSRKPNPQSGVLSTSSGFVSPASSCRSFSLRSHSAIFEKG